MLTGKSIVKGKAALPPDDYSLTGSLPPLFTNQDTHIATSSKHVKGAKTKQTFESYTQLYRKAVIDNLPRRKISLSVKKELKFLGNISEHPEIEFSVGSTKKRKTSQCKSVSFSLSSEQSEGFNAQNSVVDVDNVFIEENAQEKFQDEVGKKIRRTGAIAIPTPGKLPKLPNSNLNEILHNSQTFGGEQVVSNLRKKSTPWKHPHGETTSKGKLPPLSSYETLFEESDTFSENISDLHEVCIGITLE